MKCENSKCGNDHDGSYGSGRFCSSNCSQSYSSSSCDDTRLKDAICPKCHKPHKIKIRAAEKLTCCEECKPSRTPKKRVLRDKVKLYCENCGGERGRDTWQCCSNDCSRKLKLKLKYESIENDNGIGHTHRQLKRYLIMKNGNICSMCKGYEWNNQPMPLVMDHINGRAHDNRLENLRLVCGNCDMQLPTYKSKNKNSDRRR